MNLLYPRLTLRQFLCMTVFGFGGALIAGVYGILHDQVTFEIGPEYFTEFKFQQFHYLSKTQPERIVVAEIGFLATWWVGFFAGWFMGRVSLPHLQLQKAARLSLKGVAVMMLTALVFATASYLMAPASSDDPRMDTWERMLAGRDVIDPVAFVQVAYIHNASYLGGLMGLIFALMWMRKARKSAANSA